MRILHLLFLGLLLPMHSMAMYVSDTRSALFSAAQDGDWETLFSILDRYPGLINSRDYSGNKDMREKSLLDVVAAGCHTNQNAVVDRLFERGFSLSMHVGLSSQCLYNGRTPLHYAAYQNNYKVIDVLCRNGCDKYINTQAYDPDIGMAPPLHVAVTKNNFEMVKKLYQWGANIDEPCSRFKWTPLHIAVVKESLEMVQLLIELGADVYAKTSYGSTPRMSAGLRVDTGGKAIKRLLKEAEKEREGAVPLRLLRPLS